MPGDRPLVRPLLWPTAAFVAGLGCERAFGGFLPTAWAVAAAVALLGVLFAGVVKAPRLRSAPVVFALFAALGVLSGRAATPVLPAPESLAPYFEKPESLFLAEISAPVDFTLDVTRLPLRLLSVIEDGREVPVSGGCLLSVREVKSEWRQGERLLARLSLRRFHDFGNPGAFEYGRYQAAQGLHARAAVPDDRLLVRLAPEGFGAGRVLGALDGIRQAARRFLFATLPRERAAAAETLLIGYRHELPRQTLDAINRAGASHLFSISGLHLGLVALVTFALARGALRLFTPRLLARVPDQHLAQWAALAAALAYGLLSGMALPAWRTALTLCIAAAALQALRPHDGLSLLAGAALLILAADPEAAGSASFQLSFAAMVGLITIYPALKTPERALLSRVPRRFHLQTVAKPFAEAFFVSLAANALVLPIVAYHFHGFSLAGFLANVVLVPWVGFLVIPEGLFALALAPVFPWGAAQVMGLTGWALGGAMGVIEWFSDLSFAYFWVGHVPLWALALCYGACGLLFCRLRLRVKAAAVFGVALLGLALTSLSGSAGAGAGVLRAHVVDVGQGSATLLELPGGRAMLVDGGGFPGPEPYDVGRMVLAPYLWQEGVRRLDVVVCSHDDTDHADGLRFILERFEVGEVWESGVPEKGRTDSRVALAARRRGIPVRRAAEVYGAHDIGGARVSVLHPSPEYLARQWDGADLNDAALVLRVDYGETALVLPADISQAVERRVFAETRPGARTLLVSPHHGSRGSNGDPLYDALAPCAVVFSCGFENRFGFPAQEVLEAVARRGIPAYRTDVHGRVLAVSDGRAWAIFCHRSTPLP